MPLANGDQVTLRGRTGTIVATTDQLDSNGRGTISYGGDTFHVTILKHQATSRYSINPLTTNGSDDYLRVGVAEVAATDTSPALHALVFQDPYWAPQRHVQTPTGDWEEPAAFGSQDSTVMVAAWLPGYITLQESGTPATGKYVGFRLTYNTASQGQVVAWWQPPYPYDGISASPRGVWITDASGYVEWRDPDDTRRPVLFPRFLGARGSRAQDTWDGAPSADRVLVSVEVGYLQEFEEVLEGVDTTLDVVAVQIDVTGPSTARVAAYCEAGIERASANITGGSVSLTGLPPGVYTLHCWEVGAANKGTARKAVNNGDPCEPGQTYAVTFPTLTTVASNYAQGIIYEYGHEPLVGAEIRAEHQIGPGIFEYPVIAITGSDGSWGPVDVITPVYGWIWCDTPDGAIISPAPLASGGLWWDGAVGAKFTAIQSMDLSPPPEGMIPWGSDGAHVNHQSEDFIGYIKCVETGFVYWVRKVAYGYASENAPRWRMNGYATPAAVYTYRLYDADDQLVGGLPLMSLSSDDNVGWAPGGSTFTSSTQGNTIDAILGGKINGYAVGAKFMRILSGLPEPYRYGAEFGEDLDPLEVRIYSETTGDRFVTWTAWECAYCRAPVWQDPDDGTYTRWHCMECGLDQRGYWTSLTLSALDDHIVTVLRMYPSGGVAFVVVEGHPRPEEYNETAGYLQSNWLGSGYSRWVAVHIEFGELEGGVYTDGESVADAETRLGRTVGPCMLKAKLQADYNGQAVTFEVDVTHPYAGTQTLRFTVPPSSEGELFPLNWGPHHYFPNGYYTDITDVRLVAGSGTPHLLFVNDGPAWHSEDGVAVEQGSYTPWGCDIDFGGSEPHERIDAAGRLWLVYRHEGAIWARYRAHHTQDWSDAMLIAYDPRYSWPCVSHAPDGSVRVSVNVESESRTVIFESRDDGRSWESKDASG